MRFPFQHDWQRWYGGGRGCPSCFTICNPKEIYLYEKKLSTAKRNLVWGTTNKIYLYFMRIAYHLLAIFLTRPKVNGESISNEEDSINKIYIVILSNWLYLFFFQSRIIVKACLHFRFSWTNTNAHFFSAKSNRPSKNPPELIIKSYLYIVYFSNHFIIITPTKIYYYCYFRFQICLSIFRHIKKYYNDAVCCWATVWSPNCTSYSTSIF